MPAVSDRLLNSQLIVAVAEDQYNEIISSPEAWLIADDGDQDGEDRTSAPDIKTTNSARRVKALIHGVTGTFTCVPSYLQSLNTTFREIPGSTTAFTESPVYLPNTTAAS
jgi:hypothetical protein